MIVAGIVAWIGWVGFRNEPALTHLDVNVVGLDYHLYFQYPGPDSVLGTSDDRLGTRNFFAPANARVDLNLTSRDFVYLVEIPEVGLYEVAAPGLEFKTRIETGDSGVHSLLGSQMCGYDHPELIGDFVVQHSADFRRTVRKLSPAPSPANRTQ
ncbi:cytochrome c oxidase subunit II [Stieleria maiorica]|uniref:hypothetical protein n=1 Tax=Stieleria maiorica TaxID=2795974 RepID=UPI0011C8E731|nr:hypothetical protein [Stieleria maiorica]